MLKSILIATGLGLSLVPNLSKAQNNFSSGEGIQQTCQLQAKASYKLAKNAADKQSQVICRDIALLKQIAQWVDQMKVNPNKDFTSKDFDSMLRKEITLIRNELNASRQVLESLQLKPNEGLMLEPAQWQFDLNGDGKIQTWEKYFFAIVKPGERAWSLSMPSDDAAYYQQHFNLEAKFQVDQSDVYWALAYHQFFEGFANLILSFQLDTNNRRSMRIKMIDSASLQRAHALIGSGFATSNKMRLSLLAETDDKDEWIPNPKQKNHVFPLAMDQEAFDIWGNFLSETITLWNGKTVLAVPTNAGGVLGAGAKMCAADEGLNVAQLFKKAPTYFDNVNSLKYACAKITAELQPSKLPEMAAAALERGRNNPKSPEWHFLRYFYWVN